MEGSLGQPGKMRRIGVRVALGVCLVLLIGQTSRLMELDCYLTGIDLNDRLR